MTAEERSFDWRVPAVWAVLLAISMVAQTYVYVADEARRGVAMGFDRALVIQGTSHLVIAALLPALYWLQRRWPASGGLAQHPDPAALRSCRSAWPTRPGWGRSGCSGSAPSWARPIDFP